MKAIKKRIMLFILVLPILMGCSTHSDVDKEMDEKFSELISLSDMNKSLQIAVYSKEGSFHLGSKIPLIVSNKSTHFVYFDVDSHIRLLTSAGGQWEDIPNAIKYSGTMLLSPQGTPLLDLQYTDVRPILDESNLNTSASDILLHIVVIGEIMEGDTRTGENVGAYIDVLLQE